VGKGQRLPSELEMELARAREELAEVKMERDLLKKGLQEVVWVT
jgi:transposase